MSQNRTAQTEARLPNVGELVAQRYQLIRVLGEGGFAKVYEASDIRASGRVAIKCLHPEKSQDPSLGDRFRQEVMLTRQLQHPNTIKITDTGVTETGCLYMVMEYVQGQELDKMVRKNGPMEVPRMLHISQQVLRALAEAHEKGIVHRDLKPQNIMIGRVAGEDDFVKVLDFGIAKALEPTMAQVHTKAGLVFCTPKYAAPEILMARGVTPAADIFALGLIMCEMLTGKSPIEAPSDAEVIAFALSPDPVPLPPQVAGTPVGEVMAKALVKPLDQRYQNASEMLGGLRAAMSGQMPGSGMIPITPMGFGGATPVGFGGVTPGAFPGVSSGAISGQRPGMMADEATKHIAAQQAVAAKGGGGLKAVLIALIVLVVLAGGAFGAMQFLKNRETAGNTNTDPNPDAGQVAVVEEPDVVEPVEVNWGGFVASVLPPTPAIPANQAENYDYLLARNLLLDRAARVHMRAVTMIRNALLTNQIEEQHRESAKDEYFKEVDNLVTVLLAMGFCQAADRHRTDAVGSAALIPENATARIHSLRARVEECRRNAEQQATAWDQDTYDSLSQEGDRFEERANLLVDRDPAAQQALSYQSAMVRQRAINLFLAGLAADQIPARRRSRFLENWERMHNYMVYTFLTLDLRLTAAIELDRALEYIGTLPDDLIGRIQETQIVLQAEDQAIAEEVSTWNWQAYSQFVNDGTRLWELVSNPIEGLRQEAEREAQQALPEQPAEGSQPAEEQPPAEEQTPPPG
ncbi:MAG: protein kinase [Bradymonadales bacterium]|nr:protein kinase [Bradymonadales bacterium]